jgi:hypothetical protein
VPASAVERKLAGPVERKLAEAVERKLAGPVERKLAGAVDRKLAGAVERELAGAVERELAGAVERELAGAVERELAGAARGRVRLREQGLAERAAMKGLRHRLPAKSCLATAARALGDRLSRASPSCRGKGYKIEEPGEITRAWANLAEPGQPGRTWEASWTKSR